MTPHNKIGPSDSHRRQRLLDLAELLSRTDGGAVQLRWPDHQDVLNADARRDLPLAPFGNESPGMLTLGQQIRTHSAIARAGASFITVPLLAETGLPSIDRSKKAAWESTSADVAPTLNLTSTTPKRLSAFVTSSKRLLKTSPILAAGFLEAQLLSAIGAALDDAALNGTGTAQPYGLLLDPALLEEEFAGTIAVADLLAMEKAIAANHGESGDPLCWLADPATRETLRTLPRIAGGTAPVWPDIANTGPLGHRGVASPFAAASTLIFGNFADLVVIQSGAIEILSDPYAAEISGNVRLIVTGYFDICALNPASSFVRAIAAE